MLVMPRRIELRISRAVFPVKGLMAQLAWRYYDRHYSAFNPFDRDNPDDRTQPWLTPSYHIFDVHKRSSWSTSRTSVSTAPAASWAGVGQGIDRRPADAGVLVFGSLGEGRDRFLRLGADFPQREAAATRTSSVLEARAVASVSTTSGPSVAIASTAGGLIDTRSPLAETSVVASRAVVIVSGQGGKRFGGLAPCGGLAVALGKLLEPLFGGLRTTGFLGRPPVANVPPGQHDQDQGHQEGDQFLFE